MRLILKILALFFALFIIAEIVLSFMGFRNETELLFSIEPKSLFQAHETLGWKPTEGSYNMSLYHEDNQFSASLNEKGERYYYKDSLDFGPHSIDIYGCSCTFGISVSDSSTQSAYLQNMLPNIQVRNKGVPGYGLTQMFLYLQESIKLGDTPTIAVFNYAPFHDVRTFECFQWSNMLHQGISQGREKEFSAISYPSMVKQESSLSLNYTPFIDLNSTSKMAKVAVSYKLIDSYLKQKADMNKIPEFQEISEYTLENIVSYCIAHDIIPVIAVMNNRKMYPIEHELDFQSKSTRLFEYSIGFDSDEYNCSPYDPTHPNAKAHEIFAKELHAYLFEKKYLPF